MSWFHNGLRLPIGDTVQMVSVASMPSAFAIGTPVTDFEMAVIVMFEDEWFTGADGSAAFIQLAIDGVVQSGPRSVVAAHSPFGEIAETETHGFNFISDALSPGSYTAAIQWADNGQGPFCVRVRSMLILHK